MPKDSGRRRRDRKRAAQAQPVAPVARTPVVGAPAAKPSQPALSAAALQNYAAQHKLVASELKRVGIIIGALLLVLVVLSIVLK